MTAANPLDIVNVTKHYGSHRVLDNVSLSLAPGELFGLIGLNGVGKTTLIKIILDLTRPDTGSVTLFGEDCKDARARRHICYLPEKFQPSRYLRGHEYLSLCLSYFRRPFDIAKAREEAVLLDLEPDKLESKVRAYSKGMGQKLGLIGAFLVDAPFLILDEPMSGLDPKARILLKDRLLACKAQGKNGFFQLAYPFRHRRDMRSHRRHQQQQTDFPRHAAGIQTQQPRRLTGEIVPARNCVDRACEPSSRLFGGKE